MAILDVLRFPDERLRTVAAPVEKIDGTIKTLISDMLETMKDENGIGLAATQINVHKRVFMYAFFLIPSFYVFLFFVLYRPRASRDEREGWIRSKYIDRTHVLPEDTNEVNKVCSQWT